MHPHALLPRKHLGCLVKWPGKPTIKEASFFLNVKWTKEMNPRWPLKPMRLLLMSLFLQSPGCTGWCENRELYYNPRDVSLDAFRVPFKPQIRLLFYSNSVLTTLNIHDVFVIGVYKLISSQKTESRETVRLLRDSHGWKHQDVSPFLQTHLALHTKSLKQSHVLIWLVMTHWGAFLKT